MVLPHRLPRRLRLGLYALASGILLLLCVLPQDELPDTGTGDKPEHAIAWFVLTLTGYLLAPHRRWHIPAYALAFGAAVESLQATMGLGRNGDWRDLLMDALGVAIAIALFELSLRKRLA